MVDFFSTAALETFWKLRRALAAPRAAPATSAGPLSDDDLRSASAYESSPPYAATPRHSTRTATMLLLDYQNVLIESLLKDRFSGCALLHHCLLRDLPD